MAPDRSAVGPAAAPYPAIIHPAKSAPCPRAPAIPQRKKKERKRKRKKKRKENRTTCAAAAASSTSSSRAARAAAMAGTQAGARAAGRRAARAVNRPMSRPWGNLELWPAWMMKSGTLEELADLAVSALAARHAGGTARAAAAAGGGDGAGPRDQPCGGPHRYAGCLAAPGLARTTRPRVTSLYMSNWQRVTCAHQQKEREGNEGCNAGIYA